MRASTHWTLFLQSTPPGPIARAAVWLEQYRPLRLEFGTAHVMRADFDPLPADWLVHFRDVRVDMLQLTPDGKALVSITGTRPEVSAFAMRLEAAGHAAEVREVAPTIPQPPLLTPSQDEAIRVAVASGYYDIPRRLNLQQLAQKLGITSASLSERLRRAEGRIIRRYTAGSASTPWDERTLFDIAAMADRRETGDAFPEAGTGEKG
ncbi:MAG TPA: helix-turn-helix domain-containing protein [Candidatus Thermoplasmatota archaeon]|nr:helix-turn-helix domain-containing protein [Candidatus Thermoplasmatota archaeon]